MELTQAVNVVVADQRENDPGMSAREAVEHARDTIDVEALYDHDDDSYPAYITVLMATTTRLEQVLSEIERTAGPDAA